MKKDNKSDCTINFTRKALNFLAKHTSLAEPEAVKMFVATLKTSDSYKKNINVTEAAANPNFLTALIYASKAPSVSARED